jgi:orotate phosphoribosyltransferase
MKGDKMKPIILPFDGIKSSGELFNKIRAILKEPLAIDLVSFIKLNDAIYSSDLSAIAIIKGVKTILKEFESSAGIFLDLKIADTSGTNKNTLKHFVDAGVAPDIFTVRDSVSAKGFLELRRISPDTKLALVSMLTDTPVEECRRRNGMIPSLKIMNDMVNITLEYAAIRNPGDKELPFDMVVCSPLELKDLMSTRFSASDFQYIVPGIRDAWMESGQQARSTGIKEALNLGATYVVVGSQMTEGNPKEGVSAEESRQRTTEAIRNANYTFIDRQNPINTLFHCDGYYRCPEDTDGNYLGPLAAYAGKDAQRKNKVGNTYFNFAKAEENPMVCSFYGSLLADKIKSNLGSKTDVVLGAPMGGIFLAAELGKFLNCRRGFVEKKVTQLADKVNGKKEESELIMGRHTIREGDLVIIVEDVCNNFSTTEKYEKLIEAAGAKLLAIACAINRSNEVFYNGKPVISVCHIPSDQFTQDDPKVKALVDAGKVIWDPKHQWQELKQAMLNNK